ncbi:hypothetical protein Ancab_021699 [Ancistrocladus abbreviatus]
MGINPAIADSGKERSGVAYFQPMKTEGQNQEIGNSSGQRSNSWPRRGGNGPTNYENGPNFVVGWNLGAEGRPTFSNEELGQHSGPNCNFQLQTGKRTTSLKEVGFTQGSSSFQTNPRSSCSSSFISNTISTFGYWNGIG